MKKSARFVWMLVLLTSANYAHATASSSYTTLVSADQNHCRIAVVLPEAGLVDVDTDVGLFQAIEQEGMIPVSDTGDPALQALAWTLEIPATAAVQYQLQYEVSLIENVDLIPEMIDAPDPTPLKAGTRWQEDRFFPETIITLSEPVITRNHRLVQINLTPYQYNPVTRQLRVYNSLEVDFSFDGENSVNQIERSLPRSATFENLLQHNVINYEAMNENSRDYDVNLGLDPILYIYDSTAEYYLSPLLEWKRQKGQIVYTATQQQVSLTSYSSVKSYIQTAYNSWENPPVFVALVGDPSYCSFTAVTASNSTGDHDYSRLEGGDMLGDVFVGRLSVNNVTMLQNVVNKQINYEKTPYMADPSWMSSAHLYADSNSASGWSTVFTSDNIKQKLIGAGISNVTDCYSHECSTPEATSITNAFNDGILYFNYRGYWYMNGWTNSHANNLTNNYMLPFVVDITCSTGDFVNDYCLSEGFYQVGTLANPRGAVASIGTATSGTNTRCNNVVDLGIFGGIFDYLLPTAGEALFQGKFDLWMSYHEVNSSYVTNFSNWNNLMGDPSLELRMGIPRTPEITHAGSVVSGAQSYPVQVLKSGNPVAGALVCLYQAGGAQVKLLTNSDGEVLLPLEGQFNSGNVTLTVTKRDLLPYSDPMTVISQSLWVDVAGSTIDDNNSGNSSGNNNGQLNPGEEIELTLNLENLGTATTAYSVTATISSADPRVTIQQDYSTFNNIAPGGNASSNSLYLFQVSNQVDAELPHNITLNVDISTSGGDFITTEVLDLSEPVLRLSTLQTDPTGDNQISQGESGEVNFELINWGTLASGTLTGTLATSDPQVTIVTATATFNNIVVGGSGLNLTPFLVRPAGNIFNGHPVPLTLTLENSDGHLLTVAAEFNVGPVGVADPLGPVEDYYCLDSGDLYYSNHPTYNWVEIAGSGTIIPLTDSYDEADDSYVISLPFNFVYFGSSFTTVTVCSNGWLAMGNQADQVNFRNYPIPTSIGPDAMIAPFWDDLRVNTSGSTRRVYYLNDVANHRFIVEWYQVLQVGSGSPTETFQVILYDQDYLPTANGDILFQYQDVTNNTNNYGDNDYATVGIENLNQTDGINYSYWNMYPDGAAPLTDGLALLFTQDPGFFSFDDSQPPSITHNPVPIQDGTGPFTLEADLVDPSGIDTASLFWSLNGVNFTEVVMTLVIGDSWEGIVPMQPLGTDVWYYFWARDASDNHNEATSGIYTFINGNLSVYFAIDVENGEEGLTHHGAAGWGDQWHISSEDSYSPTHSWKCGDSSTGTYIDLLDSRLVLPELTINPYTQLNFRHRIQAEVSGLYPDSAYDGGIIEISDNGGASWELLLPGSGYNKAFRAYSGGSPCTHPFEGATPCFSGEFGWTEATVDLDGWSGQDATIRFRFGSDQATGLEGWYIDDVTLTGLSFEQPEPLTIQIVYNNPFVTVSWNEIPQATAYRVYSSTNPFSGFELIQEGSANSYTGYATGETLFFRVTWLD
ncbi:MAG: hypothetical protein ISR91_04955 [Candidatus Delongbacteria bacterium]|nr:hypothetical protein [Candidatus Delongbacteria bacterium]